MERLFDNMLATEDQLRDKEDTFMKAMSEFATQRWNEALLEVTGPGGALYEKVKKLLKEYYQLFEEIKEKVGFQLTDRLTTLKGELDSLGLDYVYYQGLKDGGRLYRLLTGD